MKLHEERWFTGQGQHAFFDHCALDVVVLNDYVFFQYFYRVQFVGAFALGQHYLRTYLNVERLN